MRRVCVFCGSSAGASETYADAARAMGRTLVARNLSLVYGGGHVGLMGILADAVLEAGGEAIGVIPHALNSREIAHLNLTTLHVVDSMHERKAKMAAMSDAFVAMPGGFGTYEEFFEAVTWTQLGVHKKPCGLLNVAAFNEGYRYEDFNEDTDRMAAYGLGALVAGGIAAKAGFFAKLGALLLAFKKFIVMGLVALGAFLAKLFRGRKAGSEGVSG